MTITFKCHRTRWINAIFLSWRRIIIYFCRRDSRNKFFHQENVRARLYFFPGPSSHYNNYALAAPQQRVASGLRPAAPPALYSCVIIRAAVWFLAAGNANFKQRELDFSVERKSEQQIAWITLKYIRRRWAGSPVWYGWNDPKKPVGARARNQPPHLSLLFAAASKWKREVSSPRPFCFTARSRYTIERRKREHRKESRFQIQPPIMLFTNTTTCRAELL